jgi:carboxylesterase
MPFKPSYEVHPDRLPYLFTAEGAPHGNRVGALVLHGFMGSPLSSRPMAEYLNRHGLFVHCPLLPGHGTYPSMLNRVPRRAWLAEAEEAYHVARAACDDLFLIAHSMGNILAAHVALKFGGVRGIAMLAPVYDVPDPRLRYVKYARFFSPWYYPHKSKRESMQQLVRERVLDFDPTVDYDSPAFQAELPRVSRVPLSGMHEMVRMIEMGRRLWPRLDVPVRIYTGEDDHAAPPDNARQIFSRLPHADKQLTIYPHVGHELMRPFEPIHATVWQSIADFFVEHAAIGALPAQTA